MSIEFDGNIRPIVLSRDELLGKIKDALDADRDFHLTVTGFSMQPFLVNKRDCVTLVKCDVNTIRRGDILLYTRPGGAVILHRVYKVCKDGTLTMIGDNQWVLENGVLKANVIARVSTCFKKGKMIVCGKSFSDRLMKLWLIRMKAPRLFQLVKRFLVWQHKVIYMIKQKLFPKKADN